MINFLSLFDLFFYQKKLHLIHIYIKNEKNVFIILYFNHADTVWMSGFRRLSGN